LFVAAKWKTTVQRCTLSPDLVERLQRCDFKENSALQPGTLSRRADDRGGYTLGSGDFAKRSVQWKPLSSYGWATDRSGHAAAVVNVPTHLQRFNSSRALSAMKTVCRRRFVAEGFAALLIIGASSVSGHAQITPDAGSTALKRGDYKSDEEFYRKSLAQFPTSPETFSNLGIALQMQGKSSDAIHAFKQALIRKQMPRIYALLAEEKCKVRDLDGARPMIEKITREDVLDQTILAIIAPCYLELDDPIGSIRAYKSLLSYHDYLPDLALIQLAKSYRKAGQFFFGLLSNAPDNSLYISTIREARDNGVPDARGAFEAAARSSSHFQPNLDFLGAVARWREHPQDTALLYLLTVLSSEQSMQQVETCAETYPTSPYLAQLKAEMLADQGHDDEAVAQYTSLMRTHPELPDLLFDLGMLFRKEREWDKALKVFQRQLAKDPDDERGAARTSEALFRLGRWKELTDFLSRRVAAPNPPLWAMLDFADAKQFLNRPEQAITTLEAAEQSYPADKVVHYRLSRLYRLTGRAAQSEKELKLFHALSN
jgi:tetratricopeptide (TPR) repeat protein